MITKSTSLHSEAECAMKKAISIRN